VPPFAYLERMYQRATGAEPFRVPERWLQSKAKLDPKTPFTLSTNNDIVGGNSGSPLVDAQGRLVGLMFDGNIHSISGSYWFDTAKNRSIAVHPAIMKTALTQVYDAGWIASELGLK
jgi:S1-C subfamily serine protease